MLQCSYSFNLQKTILMMILIQEDAFNQQDYWQEYANKIAYVNQLMMPLVLEKNIKTCAYVTTQIKAITKVHCNVISNTT